MRIQKGWNLEGGGPWRILDTCTAERHNTLFAGKRGCRCPRAVALYHGDLERMRLLAQKRRAEVRVIVERIRVANVPAWFKLGPWKISPLCKARGHNSLTWARGSMKNIDHKCTCPRALWLLEEYKASRNEVEKAQRVRNKIVHRNTSVVVAEPNWQRGACRADVTTAELGFNDEVSKKGIADRMAAKELCQDCPMSMFRQCQSWIVAKEAGMPGVMGGVYAGMDRWNRQGFELALVGRTIKRTPYAMDSAEVN